MDILAYLTTVLEGDKAFGKTYSYQQIHKPLYRGLYHKHFDREKYKPGVIGCWPQFTSTTTNMVTANTFSQNRSSEADDEEAKSLLFEIYLTNTNSPAGNIEFKDVDLNQKSVWTNFPGEEEVLLFPFFTFQVVKITQTNKFC